ncbi:cysteine desulfurase [Aquihabitans sp. G128]|uniref:cysteine desulfurase family protein n=1 Tax=Aquihabitans sp. G128 TaxID=2849779 RepID=UPI001C24FFF7|nr:cysteine desulfurase family protein [Aquihabitans sp. G128]QXC60954.1 cysteine desulfurase [Aquihabitans sp. G128]
MSSRSYLDFASTSPLRPEALAAVVAALQHLSGDPGRIHEEGLASRVALEQARDQVAGLLGTRGRSVVFTSSASEAIAAATWGAADRARGRSADPSAPTHQVVTAVEHSAVRFGAERAGEVTIVPVDGFGRVDAEAVLAAIRPDTAAVHVQWGNHEVGTVQPVADVVAGCRERKVLVHVDAAQAAGRVPIGFDALGADLLSVSGHKLGGPAGTGALLVRRGLRLAPLLVGGDQERARRAGLEPVAALVGFGAACAALSAPATGGETGPPEAGPGTSSAGAGTRLDAEAAAASVLTDRIRAGLAELDGVHAYGDPVHRLPHLVCVGIDGIEPQGVLLGLDRAGVAAHSGSACSSESLEPSPVLEAMGVDAHRSLRLSVGWTTTAADVDRALAALAVTIDRLRALAAGA